MTQMTMTTRLDGVTVAMWGLAFCGLLILLTASGLRPELIILSFFR